MKKTKKIISKIVLTTFITTNLMVSIPQVSIAKGLESKIKYAQNLISSAKGAIKDNINKNKKHTINLEDKEATQLIVKYKNDKSKKTIKKNLKSQLSLTKLETPKEFSRIKTEILEFDNAEKMDSIIKELEDNPNVEYVQPNYKLTTSSVPSDARFTEQWNLQNNGQEVEGTTGRTGVDINAVPAWDLTTGDSTVVIGILDTGIDISHEELQDNIYENTKEIADNGIDEDNNGYIDDVNGWDFINADNTVYDDSKYDLHGTNVAGIIAAASNSKGISGAAPDVKILPLKFINGNSGYTCDAIEAIEYAVSMGVEIINCSFGGTDDNQALKDAMENSGILFICAAGNRGADVEESPVYPAAFSLSNILSAASINNMGILDQSSSYGSRIDVAAPGVNIITTSPDNTYDYLIGTSAAAANVTGEAALLKSYLPDLTSTQIKERIKNNVVKCAALEGKIDTEGRIDAYAALTNNPPGEDNYIDPDGETETTDPGEDGYQDDTWYTMDQLSKIKEQLHYGESGVNPSTGNYSFTVNDMSVSAPGFQINISRTYNSKNEKTYPMGRGWTFGFEGSIYGTNTIQAVLPNGSVQIFKKDSEGTYTPQDSRSELVKNSDNTYTLTTKDQYKYTFNTSGRLTEMKDRDGNTVVIEVDDTTGNIKTITDGAGRTYTIEYNSSNLISKITDPMDRTVTYEYTDKKLTKVTDPTGSTMSYNYDSHSYINQIKDNQGKTIETLEYTHTTGDNQGKITEATDALGDKTAYTYDNINRKTTITENETKQWVYWYDTSMYITKTQDPEGNKETTEYYTTGGKNKYGEKKSTTDKYGNKTTYEIDDKGNVTKITNPDLSCKKYEYDDKNNITKEIDEEGNKTYYKYDTDQNKLIKKIQPKNGTDEYTEETSDTEPYSITKYEYYTNEEAETLGYTAKGLLKSITTPENNTTTYTYDENGNIQTIKDAENNTTTYENNQIGWKTAETTPKGYRTEYTYNNNGQLEKKTLNNGETTRIIYDAMGRKTQEIAPNQYNQEQDDITNHTYTGDHGYKYTYNDSGKLQTATDPQGYTTSYTYDIYGNIETKTQPNASIYRYEYDTLNRQTKKYFKENQKAEETLLEENTYGVTTDSKKQITNIKNLNENEKAITVKIYDYAGRLIEQQNPDGTKIKKEYTKNGQVETTTDENGSITYYKYDGQNRLTEKYEPFEIIEGNTKYTYTKNKYDKEGNKITEKTGKEKVDLDTTPENYIEKNYTYNRNGKIKTKTDSEGRKTEYSYDKEGNITKEETYIDTENKNTTEYQNNHLGKITSKKKYIDKGDIYGNTFGDTEQTALTTTYTYDKNGNLETTTTPDNITTTNQYDSQNRKTSTTKPGEDEEGNQVETTITKTYTWDGNIETSTDAKGNITQYTYTKRGKLKTITNAKTGTTAYYYDTAGRTTAEISPKNYDETKTKDQMNRTEYTYDLMGRIKTKTEKYIDQEGNWNETVTKAYKYNNSGSIEKELDALGYQAGTGSTVDEKINTGYGTEYTYNLAGKEKNTLDPESKDRGLPYTTKKEYDAIGRKTKETNAKGIETENTIDGAGNIIEIKINNKTIQENKYDLLGRLTSTKDGKGNTTTIEYNALNQIRKTTTPSDQTINQNQKTYQYDQMGNQKKQQDSLGKVILYTYDNQGRQTSCTEEKENGTQSITTKTKYDQNGNIRYTTDPKGTTTQNKYDQLNRLIETTTDGKTTTYTYDKNSNLETTTDWNQNTTQNKYDALNRITEKKDAYGKTIEKIEYNKNSIQIKSYDALGNMTQYSYDKNNRQIAKKDPEEHITSQTYDNVGNIQTKTDGKGQTTTYSYDEYNRLETVTNPKGEKTSYTYDQNGNMLTQTDPKGNQTKYEYNAINMLVKKIDPQGEGDSTKTETYTYYPDGSQKTKTDRNQKTTSYTYDIHGRLIEQAIGAEKKTYTYDENGNQLTITDETGTTKREYDNQNRVTAKTVPEIGTTTYQYDITTGTEEGNIAEKTTDPKGNITKKEYDKIGRLKTVAAGGKTTTYTYYDNGNRKTVENEDGTKEEYTYYKDNQNKTVENKKADGTTIDSYSYEYDEAHNQTKKIDNKGTTIYTYDSLNRLEKITEPDGKITTYTYDKAGNRESETENQNGEIQTTNYTYNEQNRLEKTITNNNDGTTETTNYTYDNNGNMLTKTTTQTKAVTGEEQETYQITKAGESSEKTAKYEYNQWNQISRAIEKDKTIENKYNGEGYRVEKTENGETTKYLYEYDKVILEVDSEGNETAHNVYGQNLLTRTAGSETYNYMYNGHADVTALINVSTGEVEATYYYDAFGNIIEKTGEADNNITYGGYQYEEELDLYYLNSRYYDSKIARFLQEDTYQGQPNDPLSLNLYTYCANNPIRYWDPTGHRYKIGDDGMIQHIEPGETTITYPWEDDYDECLETAREYSQESVESGSDSKYFATNAQNIANYLGIKNVEASSNLLVNLVKLDNLLNPKKGTNDIATIGNLTFASNGSMYELGLTSYASEGAGNVKSYWDEYQTLVSSSFTPDFYLGVEVTYEYQRYYQAARKLGIKDTISLEEFVNINGPIWEATYDERREESTREFVSFAIGFTPADIVKDLADFSAGKDVITGKDSNRLILAACILTPELVDKILKHGLRQSDLVYENAAHNVVYYAKYKEMLRATEAANPLVDSLRQSGTLPSNFITKAEAVSLGWKPGKALNNYAPGKQIGGDIYQNSNDLLPNVSGRTWYEADIGVDYKIGRNNPKNPGTRLLYSNDGQLYVSVDHYETAEGMHFIGTWK